MISVFDHYTKILYISAIKLSKYLCLDFLMTSFNITIDETFYYIQL